MVREGKQLFLVTNELNLGLTKKDCDAVLKDLEFQRVLRGERLKFYKELAADPNRSKQSNIGTLMFLADMLIAKEMYDKAANVMMNVMKAEGQLEDKTAITVFGNITDKDVQLMKATIDKRKQAELTN